MNGHLSCSPLRYCAEGLICERIRSKRLYAVTSKRLHACSNTKTSLLSSAHLEHRAMQLKSPLHTLLRRKLHVPEALQLSYNSQLGETSSVASHV